MKQIAITYWSMIVSALTTTNNEGFSAWDYIRETSMSILLIIELLAIIICFAALNNVLPVYGG